MQSLKKNASWLYLIQFANQLIPLITLPVVARALGADEFGRMSLIIAVVGYAILISDYGFSLSVTAAISVNRSNTIERSIIFWETLAIKITLALACAVVLFAIVVSVPSLSGDFTLYLIAFGAVIGSACTPTWYYHGMERLPYVGIVLLIIRASAAPATIYFVQQPEDVFIALVIATLSSVVSAAVLLGHLYVSNDVVFIQPRMSGLLRRIADGWHLFLSTAAISLYTNTNTVLVGALADNRAVALFVTCEKIIRAAHLTLVPLGQAIYPRIVFLMESDKPKALELLRKYFYLVVTVGAVLFLTMNVLASEIIVLLFGFDYAGAAPILRIMAILPLLIGLSNIFGTQLMIPLGMKREFSRLLILSGLVNVILLSLLVPSLGAGGAAWSVVITELLVSLSMAFYLRWRGVRMFSETDRAKF